MKILDSGKPLSKSVLCELHRQYYDQKGVSAWARTVPFYITSNPYIANTYARIIVRYLQDLIVEEQISSEHPIYIVELGAGTGQFGYSFVNAFFQLLSQLEMDLLNFCYILTDVAHSNITFWKDHELWQPYIQAGKVDAGIYNIEEEADITLAFSNRVLSPQTCKNPLIVIGNYVFDTVSQDAFYFKDNTIFECLAQISAKDEIKDEDGNIHLDTIEIQFDRRQIQANYYDDPAWNGVLDFFAEHLQESSLLLPVGGFICIRNLLRISHNHLLLLAGDKGYTSIENLTRKSDPTFNTYGSLSWMVNFPAIGQLFKILGGDYWINPDAFGLKLGAFSMTSFHILPETSLILRREINGFGPNHVLSLKKIILNDPDAIDIDALLSFLELSLWDPKSVRSCSNSIINRHETFTKAQRNTLINGLKYAAENVYPIPQLHDYYFDIAKIVHIFKLYQEAFDIYQKSLDFYGDTLKVHYNIALCYILLKDARKALGSFKLALKIDPECHNVLEWIKLLEAHLDFDAETIGAKKSLLLKPM